MLEEKNRILMQEMTESGGMRTVHEKNGVVVSAAMPGGDWLAQAAQRVCAIGYEVRIRRDCGGGGEDGIFKTSE